MLANYAMKLEGPNNVRDLGGYCTMDARCTRKGQFLRGDNPTYITEKDCEDLYHYGVRLQIDLRSDYECEKHPSTLKGYKDIDYHHFAMLDEINSNPHGMEIPDCMSEVYCKLMDNMHDSFRDIFKLMLQYPDECVFFNCTAGRDRTGLLALLLLKAANCSDETIVNDYLATDWNIRVEIQKTLKLLRDYNLEDKNPMRNPRQAIELTLEHFAKTYGTIDDYLNLIGLSEAEVYALKRKIVRDC